MELCRCAEGSLCTALCTYKHTRAVTVVEERRERDSQGTGEEKRGTRDKEVDSGERERR